MDAALPSKQALRSRVLAARGALGPAERLERSRAVTARLLDLELFHRCRSLALYAAIGAEVDTSEIAHAAASRGKRVAFPRVRGGARALRFAACALDELVPGPHGTREPPPSAPDVEAADLDLVLVPGVAFDARGGRLGRGGGHYDATLAALPRGVARLGLAFELQVVPAVPREAHDEPLDGVITEARVLFRLPPGPAQGKSSPP